MTAQIKPPKKKKYLTNKELLHEIENSHEKGAMTPLLAEMLMKLNNRYAQRSQYANYSYNEDMRAFALLTMVKVWKSFDPKRSQNPFAYFTQIIKHSYFQLLNSEAKHRSIRDELLIANGDNPSMGFIERGEDGDGGNDGFNYNAYINYNNLYEEDVPTEVEEVK